METPKNTTHRVQELIDRYNRELMETYRQQKEKPQNWLDESFPVPDISRDRAALAASAPPAEAAATAMPPGVPENSSAREFSGRGGEPAPVEEAPPPAEAMPVSPAEEVPPSAPAPGVPTFPYTDSDLNGQLPMPVEPPPQQQGPAPFVGFLRVFVFTGQNAEPLPGAHITVFRQEGETQTLYANTVTGRDGLTPVITLPSVNPSLTMQPELGQPYIPYNIRVSVDGFYTTIYENVPVYGGNSVTQPAGMIPIIPGEHTEEPLRFRSGGPADL